MDIQCSPVKYTPGQSPQVIVMAMLKESNRVCPELAINATGGANFDGIIRLPIFGNKVFEGIDMNEQVFKKNWDDISCNRPDTFTKTDIILKNPAPAHVPVGNVLQQVQNFLAASLNMKSVLKTQSETR